MALEKQYQRELDDDLQWLLAHVPDHNAPSIHSERADALQSLIEELIRTSRLPFTIGLFGGWGCGKTTFLGVLAQSLSQRTWQHDCAIVYFNAWKYAGFMEIVPALIYKVLRCGNHAQQRPDEIIAKIMVSLGKDYSDRLGKWAETHFGIDPVSIYKDVQNVARAVRDSVAVSERVIQQYYTQVDEAQDLLKSVFADPNKCTIVLIDELDRCDPDEAFAVIKQLRVFFGMRQVPICFTVFANPEPIGLAIKHRYGLDTPGSDFEARRILEKFVDTYIDMTEPIPLDDFARWLWQSQGLKVSQAALLMSLDQYVNADFAADTARHATALQAMRSGNPFYCNLRLLDKSLRYVCRRKFDNMDLLWTAWHLEIAEQMNPEFRQKLGWVANDVECVTRQAVDRLFSGPMEWRGDRLSIGDNPRGTTFGLSRSLFLDCMRQWLAEKEREQGADVRKTLEILNEFLADYRKMDFIILMSLLPALEVEQPRGADLNDLKADLLQLDRPFGWLLANY